jgi:hypothetical protein
MMLEDGVVIGREEILRPPPRPFPLDDGIDGDVADFDLLHGVFAPFLGAIFNEADQLRKPGASWPVRATYSV